MTTELVPMPRPTPELPAIAGAGALLDAFLAGRKATTLRAYLGDLGDFAAFLGTGTGPGHVPEALESFLGLGQGGANACALAYRERLLGRGLATATVGRRLAALRSVVALARTLGRVSWALDVRAPKVERRRDTRGPDEADRRRLWKLLKAMGDSKQARRDRAILALLFDLGLRRGEVVGIDLADVDFRGSTVAVLGKGRREKGRLTLPAKTREALAGWVEARGDAPGPLFHGLDRGTNRGGSRLTGDGLCKLVKRIGAEAKMVRALRPHGLRHAAITAALDAGCDVRTVRKFSRHAKLETVMLYDDQRTDAAGEVAARVSRERK